MEAEDVVAAAEPAPAPEKALSEFERYLQMALAAPYAFSTWEYVLSIVDKEVRGVGEGAAFTPRS
jgi:hypothetical protein